MFVELFPARIRCRRSCLFPDALVDFLSKYALAHAPTIAAATAVPTPPKTSCQLSAMNFIASFLLKLIGRETLKEARGSRQGITSGDGSQNYQALRDVTVHNHALPPVTQSLIEKPTLEQIRQFDPKTDQIIRIAKLEQGIGVIGQGPTDESPARKRSIIIFSFVILLMFLPGIALIAWLIFDFVRHLFQ